MIRECDWLTVLYNHLLASDFFLCGCGYKAAASPNSEHRQFRQDLYTTLLPSRATPSANQPRNWETARLQL
jgi:hypothetical protein